MNPSDFESLINQLRFATPAHPDKLTDTVLARLGPSTRQAKIARVTGTCACAAAIAVALVIGASAAREPVETVPPELTLVSHAANPLLSW
ncbi:MAG: hypothetical protein KDN18_18680 [Verrucomicrobiae bacterium]|nr:hypothetical protein [Verrucomicrobiae bacterium]